jgi:hypothetical protein
MTDKLTLAADKPHDQQASSASPAEDSEDRMRRALEQLGGGSSPGGRSQAGAASAHEVFPSSRKHRFVQDGDVVVTHVQSRRDRSGRSAPGVAPAASAPESRRQVTPDALAEERGLRLRAERAAQEAQGVVGTLQTKLRHCEIALGEARDATQAQVQLHAETVAKLQAELQAHVEQVRLLQDKLDRAEEERRKLDQALPVEQHLVVAGSLAAKPTPARAPARKISRLTRSVAQSQKARDPDAEEPQPVKWWLGNKE